MTQEVETHGEVGTATPVPHEESLFQDPGFWVSIAFLLFVLVLVYFKVPKLIAGLLDKRAVTIKTQLEEARALRDQAEKLLADYRKKQRAATTEAQAIIADAQQEAQRFLTQSRTDLDALAVRRTEAAKDKIAQAETQAVKDVKNAAVDVAIAAARRLIKDQLDAKKASSLIDAGIKDVQKTLH